MPTLIQSLSKILIYPEISFDFVKEKYKNKNYNGIDEISKNLEFSQELLNLVGLVETNIKKLKKLNFKIYTDQK